MAHDPNQLYATYAKGAHPRMRPTEVKNVTMKNLTAAPLLPIGTPVAFDTATAKWVPYAQGGATGMGIIRGFIYDHVVQLHATLDVIAVILYRGTVHRDDINTPEILLTGLAAASTEAQLDTALLADTMRTFGLDVEGIPGVH